jgi:hypothetical protein
MWLPPAAEHGPGVNVIEATGAVHFGEVFPDRLITERATAEILGRSVSHWLSLANSRPIASLRYSH